jgi:hypothetical protein
MLTPLLLKQVRSSPTQRHVLRRTGLSFFTNAANNPAAHARSSNNGITL